MPVILTWCMVDEANLIFKKVDMFIEDKKRESEKVIQKNSKEALLEGCRVIKNALGGNRVSSVI